MELVSLLVDLVSAQPFLLNRLAQQPVSALSTVGGVWRIGAMHSDRLDQIDTLGSDKDGNFKVEGMMKMSRLSS